MTQDASKTTVRLTPAQRRALDWLPSDGSWRTKPGTLVSALSSLSLSAACRGWVESQWGDSGPRGGRELRWRLTPLGVLGKAREQ